MNIKQTDASLDAADLNPNPLRHLPHTHVYAGSPRETITHSSAQTTTISLQLISLIPEARVSRLLRTRTKVEVRATLAKLGSRLKAEFEKKDDKPKAEADNKDDKPKAEAGSGSGENNKSKAEADKVAGSGSGSAGAGLTTRSEVLALASTLFPLRATCAVKACDDSIGR